MSFDPKVTGNSPSSTSIDISYATSADSTPRPSRRLYCGFRAYLGPTRATANKHLAALRGALEAAWRLGVMDTDDYLRAVDLRPIPGSRLPAGRDIEQSELAALLAHCRADDSPAGIRDAAVIGLAHLSGTRRAELVALHLADVDTDPAAIRVVGKRGKQRLVPLSPTVGPLLDAWMGLRGDSSEPLLCPMDRTGKIRLGRTLTGEAIPPDPLPADHGRRLGRRVASRSAPHLRRRPPRRRRRPAGSSAAHGTCVPLDDLAIRPRRGVERDGLVRRSYR